MLFAALLAWLERGQGDVTAFLREENRTLKHNCPDADAANDALRRRLAVLGSGSNAQYSEKSQRSSPRHDSSMASRTDCAKMDLRRWRSGCPKVLAEIRRLVVRMATQNPSWRPTNWRTFLGAH
jgi:hypothetical protein